MKLKPILCATAALFSLNANALDYTSDFTDSGNKVTEVRTFSTGAKAGTTETWEWLDLTVTNGISFNTLLCDISIDCNNDGIADNDGVLNNSNNDLNANSGALADIAALSDADRVGWQTQSDTDIVNLFNAFFNLSLVDDQNHNYGTNVIEVERFITLFGDTYHEGREDYGKINGVNGSGKNSGFSAGLTHSPHTINGFNERAYVEDGENHDVRDDLKNDKIMTTGFGINSDFTNKYGTWLAREVVETPEPTSIAMFTLALLGLGARRFRNS